jgi:hypothetical protein
VVALAALHDALVRAVATHHDEPVVARSGDLAAVPRVKFRATTPVVTPGGFSLRTLDPDAPARIVAAIARLTHGSPRDVDYMVFSTNPIDRDGRWDAFLTGGATHFAADAHGRHVTRP